MAYDRSVNHEGFRCIGPTITPERIFQLREHVEDNESLREMQSILSAISGKTRLKILYLLHREPELCVCDLADVLDESTSSVSHQLRVLRQHDLVTTRRDGTTIFYALNRPVVGRYLDLDGKTVAA